MAPEGLNEVAGTKSKSGSGPGRIKSRTRTAVAPAGKRASASSANVAVRKVAAPRASKMATKPRRASSTTGGLAKRVTAAVAKALPGWKIVDSPTALAGKMEDEYVRIDKGPSIVDLKRKFLHDDVQDGADPFVADDGRVSVRIRPEKGGDAKTADVGRDGKVTIVQG